MDIRNKQHTSMIASRYVVCKVQTFLLQNQKTNLNATERLCRLRKINFYLGLLQILKTAESRLERQRALSGRIEKKVFLRQGLQHLPQAVPQRKRRNEPRLVGKSAQKAKTFVLRVCFANSRKPVFAENNTICDCVKQKMPE